MMVVRPVTAGVFTVKKYFLRKKSLPQVPFLIRKTLKMDFENMNTIETHDTDMKARAAPHILSKFKGYTLLVFLSIIWGLAFVAIREAVLDLTPINLTLLRWIIASAGFLIILPFIKAKMKFERKDLPKLLVMSITNVAGYNIALNYAETSISAGLAALLISFGPVFITLLSAVTRDILPALSTGLPVSAT